MLEPTGEITEDDGTLHRFGRNVVYGFNYGWDLIPYGACGKKLREPEQRSPLAPPRVAARPVRFCPDCYPDGAGVDA